MTDEELSRIVADGLGWRFGDLAEEFGWRDKWLGEVWWSPERKPFTKHPDFVNDPAMTVMLLEKFAALPWRVVELESDRDGDAVVWTMFYCKSIKLGRVVAEAFALAMKLI